MPQLTDTQRGHRNNKASRMVCDVINSSPIDCPTFLRGLFCLLTKVRNRLDLHRFCSRQLEAVAVIE